MPGRYSLSVDADDLQDRFSAKIVDEDEYRPRYNISPTQKIRVILDKDPERVMLARWGFSRSWSRQDLINARSEEIEKNRVFGKAFHERRCLIPADAYYEWKHAGKERLPYRIIVDDADNHADHADRNAYHGGDEGRIFSIAGIWEEAEGEVRVATITVEPNEMIREIHQRMPAILEKKDEQAWLEGKDIDQLKGLLKTYPEVRMRMYRISTDINSSRKDNKSQIKRADDAQTTLA